MNLYKYLLIISVIQGAGLLSTDYYNYMNFSFSIQRDNVTYMDDEIEELVEENSDLSSFNMSYLHKGVYEVYISYINNSYTVENASVNVFMFPNRGKYGALGFEYFFREREKFPLNIGFNIKMGGGLDIYYRSYSLGIHLYKEFKSFDYPIVPYLHISNNQILYNENNDTEILIYKTGIITKLLVKNINNSLIQDIIWFDISISANKKDLFLGLEIGLSHPIN